MVNISYTDTPQSIFLQTVPEYIASVCVLLIYTFVDLFLSQLLGNSVSRS